MDLSSEIFSFTIVVDYKDNDEGVLHSKGEEKETKLGIVF